MNRLLLFAGLFLTLGAGAYSQYLPPEIDLREPPAAECPVGCGHFLGGDLFIGLPTGVRLQAGFVHSERTTLAVDFLFGALVAHGDWVSNAVGGGPRLIWNGFDDGRANAFQINPGCYFLTTFDSGRERGGFLIAPTVDLIWIHDFHRRFAWHLGSELGIGYDDRGGAFPLVALFSGFRF